MPSSRRPARAASVVCVTLGFCALSCGKKPAPRAPVGPTENGLLEAMITGDADVIRWWCIKHTEEVTSLDGQAKARIARALLEKHFDKRHGFVASAHYLESPESVEYLLVLYLSSLDAPDWGTRHACLGSLKRIDPQLAKSVALTLLGDEGMLSTCIDVIVGQCDSEAEWIVLQQWYAQIKGKRKEYYGALTTLEGHYINLSLPEARAAYERRKRAYEAGEEVTPADPEGPK